MKKRIRSIVSYPAGGEFPYREHVDGPVVGVVRVLKDPEPGDVFIAVTVLSGNGNTGFQVGQDIGVLPENLLWR